MKKIPLSILMLIIVIILTGCGNSEKHILNCSRTSSDSNMTQTREIIYYFDNSNTNVLDLKYNYKYKFDLKDKYDKVVKDKETLNKTCEKMQEEGFECQVTTNEKNMEVIIAIDYGNENEDVRETYKLDLSREELKKYLETEENSTCVIK